MKAEALGVALLAALLVACGGARPLAGSESASASESEAGAASESEAGAASEVVVLAPPGTRIRVSAPPAERIAHTLRYRIGPLLLRFADASVEPGTEREFAEAYLARLSAREDAEVRHRPFALDGAEGMQITVRTEQVRVRALTLWRDGAISRVSITHAPEQAHAAESIIDTLRFDATIGLDPRAALDIDADPIEELPLLRVSTEQLIFREGGHAVPFPSEEAAVDVAYVAYVERRPADIERGQMLGSRFAGLPIERPAFEALTGGHFEGFAMRANARVAGRELALFGAYLDLEHGALLVRASVAVERAELWAPRFGALVRSLRVR